MIIYWIVWVSFWLRRCRYQSIVVCSCWGVCCSSVGFRDGLIIFRDLALICHWFFRFLCCGGHTFWITIMFCLFLCRNWTSRMLLRIILITIHWLRIWLDLFLFISVGCCVWRIWRRFPKCWQFGLSNLCGLSSRIFMFRWLWFGHRGRSDSLRLAGLIGSALEFFLWVIAISLKVPQLFLSTVSAPLLPSWLLF